MVTERRGVVTRRSALVVAGAVCLAVITGSIATIVSRDDGSRPTLESPTVATSDDGIWISPAELAELPTTGSAWEAIVAQAHEDWGDPDISDQNSDHDVHTLAGALYAVRMRDEAMVGRVVESLELVEGTFSDEILALSRNLLSYVIAADLIGYRSEEFDQWLEANLTRPGHARADIDTLRESALHDPTNHGAHARASTLAVALYLGDEELTRQIAARFHDWLGRSDKNFEWRELDWQGDPQRPRGINAPGAVIQGADVDGVLPEEQRRSGGFRDPAPHEGYVWEGLQGTIATAELLWRAGFDVWTWEDEALRRSLDWLYDVNDFPAEGDDRWIPWIVNTHYDRSYPTEAPTRPGKNIGFTDWTHAR